MFAVPPAQWDRPGRLRSTQEMKTGLRLVIKTGDPGRARSRWGQGKPGHQAVGVVTDTTRLVRLGAMPYSTEEQLCSGMLAAAWAATSAASCQHARRKG